MWRYVCLKREQQLLARWLDEQSTFWGYLLHRSDMICVDLRLVFSSNFVRDRPRLIEQSLPCFFSKILHVGQNCPALR